MTVGLADDDLRRIVAAVLAVAALARRTRAASRAPVESNPATVRIGLMVCERSGLQGFGVVGLLARHSADVNAALRRLARYLPLHVRGAGAALSAEGELAKLRYEIHVPNIEGIEQLGDAAVATTFNILRGLCGQEWKPVEVRFAHRAPPDQRPYRRFFGVRPTFDAAEYAVVFDARWLNRPIPEGDPVLSSLLQNHVDALEARYTGDLVEEVRAALPLAIVAGDAREEQIAALFWLHSRTLNRRLIVEGTSFRALAAECRYDVARQLLETSDMNMVEIADLIGYAEASIFTRALRRWSGTTPARWHEAHRPARSVSPSSVRPPGQLAERASPVSRRRGGQRRR